MQREEVVAMLQRFEALVERRVETVEVARVALAGRVGDLEERVRGVELGGRAQPSGERVSSRPNEGYIPAKMMMPKNFGDKPEEWRSWKEDVLDWINAHNSGVKDILVEIAKWEDWTR